jgi:hypothetical protein
MSNDVDLLADLSWDFSERFPALTIIRDYKTLVHLSKTNESFVSVFILQTICPPFLQSLSVFDCEIVVILLRMLRWAARLCPEYADQNRESFSFLYQKAVTNPNFMGMLPYFLRHFKSMDISPPSCIVPHLLSIKQILSSPLSKVVLTNGFAHFSRIVRDLSGLKDLKNEIVPTLFGLCEELCSIEDDSEPFVAFRTISITLCLELDRVFDCPFRPLFGILRQFLVQPVVQTEDLVKKAKIFECFEVTPREELKKMEVREMDSSFLPPDIPELMGYLTSISHPMTSLLEHFYSCSEDIRFTIFRRLFPEDFPEDDLTMQTFLFLIIETIPSFYEKASDELLSKKLASMLFSEALFNPAVTIFQSPMNGLIPIRRFSLHLFERLLDTCQKSDFGYYYFNMLPGLLLYPELSAEFLLMSKSIFGRLMGTKDYAALLTFCGQLLAVHHAASFHGCTIAKAFRSWTFVALIDIFENCRVPTPFRGTACELQTCLSNLLYEKGVTKFAAKLLELLLILFLRHEDTPIPLLFRFVIDELKLLTDDCEYVATPFLELLLPVTSSLSPLQLLPLQSTKLLEVVQNIIIYRQFGRRTLIAALELLQYVPSQATNYRWEKIAEVIAKQEFAEDLYLALLAILAQDGNPVLPDIQNWKAAPIIEPILRSEFCPRFMDFLKKLARASVPSCYQFVEAGLPEYLMDIITESESPEIGDQVGGLLVDILTVCCNRWSLFKFLKLVKEPKYICFLSLALGREVAPVQAFIQFSPKFGNIVLPRGSLSSPQFSLGFAFVLDMRTDHFCSDRTQLRLVRLSNKNSHLSLALWQHHIELQGNADLKVEIPENQRFTLAFSFEPTDTITIFLNDSACGSFSRQFELFEDCELFGSGVGHVRCQLFSFCVYANPKNEENLMMFFDSGRYEENFLISQAGPNSTKADFEGDLFPFPTTFWQLFLGSHGIEFVFWLFNQITSLSDNSLDDLPSMLIAIVFGLIQRSEAAEDEIFEHNGFEVVAHVLCEVSPRLLTVGFFEELLEINQILRKRKHQLRYLRDIVLNFGIWRRASVETQGQVLESWDQLSSQEIFHFLTPLFLLEILSWLWDRDMLTVPVREAFVKLLTKSLQFRSTHAAFGCLLYIMKQNQSSIEHISGFLQIFVDFIKFQPGMQSQFATAILENPWLSVRRSPAIQIQIMQILECDSHLSQESHGLLTVDFLLFNLRHASQLSSDENSAALVSFCATFVGFPDVLDFGHLLSRDSEWTITISLLPFCLSLVFFSDEALVPQFSRLLLAVFADQSRRQRVLQSLAPLTLLLIVAFAAIKSPTVIDFLVSLIFPNLAVCSHTFRLLHLFSLVSGIDFYSLQNNLAKRLVALVSTRGFDGDRQPFFDLFVNFVCFRPQLDLRKSIDQLDSEGTLAILIPQTTLLPPYRFSLKIVDGNWADSGLVYDMATALLNLPDVDCSRFLIPFSYAFHPQLWSDEVASSLERLVGLVSNDVPVWSPLLFQISK